MRRPFKELSHASVENQVRFSLTSNRATDELKFIHKAFASAIDQDRAMLVEGHLGRHERRQGTARHRPNQRGRQPPHKMFHHLRNDRAVGHVVQHGLPRWRDKPQRHTMDRIHVDQVSAYGKSEQMTIACRGRVNTIDLRTFRRQYQALEFLVGRIIACRENHRATCMNLLNTCGLTGDHGAHHASTRPQELSHAGRRQNGHPTANSSAPQRLNAQASRGKNVVHALNAMRRLRKWAGKPDAQTRQPIDIFP